MKFEIKIEQIRVNYKYDWGFIHPTQAEIISVVISLSGILLFLFRHKIDGLIEPQSQDVRHEMQS